MSGTEEYKDWRVSQEAELKRKMAEALGKPVTHFETTTALDGFPISTVHLSGKVGETKVRFKAHADPAGGVELRLDIHDEAFRCCASEDDCKSRMEQLVQMLGKKGDVLYLRAEGVSGAELPSVSKGAYVCVRGCVLHSEFGEDEWVKGRISKVRDDESEGFNVQCDGGHRKHRVKRRDIRLTGKPSKGKSKKSSAVPAVPKAVGPAATPVPEIKRGGPRGDAGAGESKEAELAAENRRMKEQLKMLEQQAARENQVRPVTRGKEGPLSPQHGQLSAVDGGGASQGAEVMKLHGTESRNDNAQSPGEFKLSDAELDAVMVEMNASAVKIQCAFRRYLSRWYILRVNERTGIDKAYFVPR